MTTMTEEIPYYITTTKNISRYNKLNPEDPRGPMIPMTHFPPESACVAMDKVRRFIERNNLPFEAEPISEKRVCIRSTGDPPEGEVRDLYKAIFESTGMQRKIDRWGSIQLCWVCREDQDIRTSFDKREIREAYEKYREDSSGAAEEWQDWWFDPPVLIKRADKYD